MMQFTEEQRKGLTEGARQRVQDLTKYCSLYPEDREAALDLSLCQIALAALEAKPVGYIHNFVSPSDAGGERVVAEENRHYGRAVYTALPVAALQLPGISDLIDSCDSTPSVRDVAIWDAAIAEVKRLNGVKS